MPSSYPWRPVIECPLLRRWVCVRRWGRIAFSLALRHREESTARAWSWCSVCSVWMFSLFYLDAQLNEVFFLFSLRTKRAPAHYSCDYMRANTVHRFCDWAPRRLPFLAGFLFAEPIRVLYHADFSARMRLVFITQSKLKLQAFAKRSHTYVCTSTAYMLTRISFWEILTDTNRKIPIRDATLVVTYPLLCSTKKM